MPDNSQSAIGIRDITSIGEMAAVEDVQREVWCCADLDVVPGMLLHPAREVGGVLVGAYDGATLAGFAFGFVGLEGGRLVLHSHMLAVRAAYGGRDLGRLLKLAQRERALARGIDLMTWTFDPLQSRNAHLNFARLGVVSDSYRADYYGDASTSELHRGLGTDRLWVSWHLDSERVRKRIAHRGGAAPTEVAAAGAAYFDATPLVAVGEDGGPRAGRRVADAMGGVVVIEIPGDVGGLLRRDPALAREWREATRAAFVSAFGAGYAAEEFIRVTRHGGAAGAYLLRRRAESGDA